jgi:hypothetical protein
MKITLDKTENHTSNLTVDIDSAEMEKFIEKARENLGKRQKYLEVVKQKMLMSQEKRLLKMLLKIQCL